ncbi:unnamed protein product [Mytilus coruscus]|uniref:Novel STAND NTPase 3 domain-containing protein n=1 Tax=Mytilus coruscus TaxID=42192 RepID=A0A6J8DZJ3_MYTCO|nr:unnamed protein product [Mytilus coruscus]
MMEERVQVLYRLICILIITGNIVLTSAFSKSLTVCPAPALWQLVAIRKCADESMYHCLYNGVTGDFDDSCFLSERYPAGSYVLYEGGLNSKHCPDGQYQPMPYASNEDNKNDKCMYLKTQCNGVGQLIHDLSEKPDKDRTCRCDYSRGYDFVYKPRNRCYCIPTEEDCSCYRKPCNNNSTKLTPDYKCQLQGIITCPVIPSVILEKDMNNNGKYAQNEYSVKRNDMFDDRVYNIKLTPGVVFFQVTKQNACVLFQESKITETYHNDLSKITQLLDKSNTERKREYLKTLRLLKWLLLVLILLALIMAITALIVILYHLCEDKQDQTTNDKTDTSNCEIVVTKGIRQCSEYLKQSKMLIIKGRRGTGKSKIARYVASRNEDHELVIMTRNDSKDTAFRIDACLQNTNGNTIVIFDEMFDAFASAEDINQAFMITEEVLKLPKVKSILTVDENDMTLADTFRRRNDDVKMQMVDLDYEFPMSKDEKRALIDRHLKNYVSRQTTHGNSYIMEREMQVSEKEVENIINTETFIGFPYMCANFFGNTDNFKLGSKYFRQPHKLLLDEIEQLRAGRSGRKDEYYRDQYCVLYGEGLYTIRPSVYQAMLLSYIKISVDDVLENCKLEHLLDIVKPPNFKLLPNEVALECSHGMVKTFERALGLRISKAALLGKNESDMICQYLMKYPYNPLLDICLDNLKQYCNDFLTSERVDLMLKLFHSINTKRTPSYILATKPTSFVASWSLLTFQKYEEVKSLKDFIESCVPKDKPEYLRDMLCSIVDEFGNNLLTYCVLWWNEESRPLISFLSERFARDVKYWRSNREGLFTENEDKTSALHFAVYFGRLKAIQTFMELKLLTVKEVLFLQKAENKSFFK